MPTVHDRTYTWAALFEGPAGREAYAIRWARRLVTIPAYLLTAAALLVSAPVLIVVSLSLDLVRRRKWGITRGLLCLGLYFVSESVGVLAAGMLWLVGLVSPRGKRDLLVDWHYALQRLWAGTLWAGTARIFGMHLEVEGDDAIPPGPVHVFARHASVADTLLPAVCVARSTGRRLRYVLKRELLWDPCLDIVGQRLPNVFVHRNSDDSARERAAVKRLGEHLGPNEGTLIYPEGTRFTAAKRERILRKLEADAHAHLSELARRLRHTLPPRPGGALALLDAAPDVDVIFLAHTGLEAATSLRNILDGTLVGQRVCVGLWRVPHDDIPRDHVARGAWLCDEWTRMDAWIAARADDVGLGSTACHS